MVRKKHDELRFKNLNYSDDLENPTGSAGHKKHYSGPLLACGPLVDDYFISTWLLYSYGTFGSVTTNNQHLNEKHMVSDVVV